MPDLVERLRAVNQDVTQPWKLCAEAADEIERLHAALEDANDTPAWDALKLAKAEIERLRDTIDGEADESASTIAHLNSEIKHWKAKLYKAVEALEEIARQKKLDEMVLYFAADIEGGYDMCIDTARATLKEIGARDA